MRITLLRRAAAVAVPALVLSGLVTSAATADATPEASSATTWLAGELTNGLFHNPNFGGFDDYGLSIDGGFAELATGNTAVAGQIRDAVAAHINDYITGEAFGDPGSTYAGPVAKALVYNQATNGTPTNVGGVNLVTRLESVTGTSGRIADVTTFADSANTIGQSFAARGLAAAGSAKASDATSFLLKQQCPAGFFRLALGDAQCADDSAPDTDATALVMLNLDSQRSKPDVAAALTRATAWLAGRQATDGSFMGSGPTATPNTNSTGLAASALGQQCRVAAADRAATYLRGLQVKAGQSGPLSTEVGAVAYDPAALALGQTDGITDDTSDQWRRATTQAGPGLTWSSSAAATVQVKAPKGFTKAGKTAKVTITGAAAGERVCVTDSTGGVAALTGTGAALTFALDVAKKSKDITVSATTGPGSDSAEVQVLGKQRLKPKLAKTVHRGHRAAVTVKKLGAKEKVKLYVDGKLVGKGKASKKGVFKGKLPSGLKLGSHKLKVVGEFKNRSGAVTFRVVG